MSPEEVCHRLGQAVRASGLRFDSIPVIELLAQAEEAEMIRTVPPRHEGWFLSTPPTGGILWQPPDYAFTGHMAVWSYWLGLGQPPGCEIKLIVDPTKMMEESMDAFLREGPPKPGLRVVRGGERAGEG